MIFHSGAISKPNPNSKYWLLFASVFHVRLFAEILQKYVFWNRTPILIGDVLIICVSLIAITRHGSRNVRMALVWCIVSIAWGILTVIAGHGGLMLGLIGIRTSVLPVCSLVIGAALLRSLPLERANRFLFLSSLVWLIIITFVALIQIILGRAHSINILPEGLGGDERHGIGDFEGYDLRYIGELFRPTSIFLHTGKYGQVSFVLSAFALASSSGRWGYKSLLVAVLGALSVGLSGQRAAMIGYLLCVIYVLSSRMSLSGALGAFTGIGMVLVAVCYAIDKGLPISIWYRFFSLVEAIPSRVRENVVEPISDIWYESGMLGSGAGTFSLGSAGFGGAPLYEIIAKGAAENSWLRIWAEQGLVGVFIWTAGYFAAIIQGVRAACWSRRSGDQRVINVLSLNGVLTLMVIGLWSNTHDVIGNTTTMIMAMYYCGAILCSGAHEHGGSLSHPSCIGWAPAKAG